MLQLANFNALINLLSTGMLIQNDSWFIHRNYEVSTMKMKIKLIALVMMWGCYLTTSQATLYDRGYGMIYDDVLNLTWAKDANLFQTQASRNANLVCDVINFNGGVINDTPNIYDKGIYTLTNADFNTNTGTMSWWGAQAWVNYLTLGGVTGWSLPSTPVKTTVKATGYEILDSQMGDLYYNVLGGVKNSSIVATHNENYNLFVNIQSYVYWSSSELDENPGNVWHFHTYEGLQDAYAVKYMQFYAWAVHKGDVAFVKGPTHTNKKRHNLRLKDTHNKSTNRGPRKSNNLTCGR
ncbi:MAG: hypothetical protein RLZ75_1427 [Pseudomonadota bacterium]